VPWRSRKRSPALHKLMCQIDSRSLLPSIGAVVATDHRDDAGSSRPVRPKFFLCVRAESEQHMQKSERHDVDHLRDAGAVRSDETLLKRLCATRSRWARILTKHKHSLEDRVTDAVADDWIEFFRKHLTGTDVTDEDREAALAKLQQLRPRVIEQQIGPSLRRRLPSIQARCRADASREVVLTARALVLNDVMREVGVTLQGVRAELIGGTREVVEAINKARISDNLDARGGLQHDDTAVRPNAFREHVDRLLRVWRDLAAKQKKTGMEWSELSGVKSLKTLTDDERSNACAMFEQLDEARIPFREMQPLMLALRHAALNRGLARETRSLEDLYYGRTTLENN